jgi:competence protein ComEA
MWEKSELRCCAKRLVFPGFTVCVFLAAAAWVLAAAAWAQPAQNLPEGRGKAAFGRVCGQCHGVQIVIKKTNTADGWADVVDDMVSRGAEGTDDDFDLVVKYLTAQFGPKVNVNKANAKELSTILELSAAEAEAIVHYRETAGSFKDWRDLERVPRIDIKKLEQEKNRIDFSTDQELPGDKKQEPPGDKKQDPSGDKK